MKNAKEVVIIGGGVIGCAIAYYLSKAGREVIVLDQGEIGTEASSAAAGLLAPLGSISGPGPFANLLLASWSMFPSLVPELEAASGLHLEYEQTGALRIMRNSKNVGNLQKRMKAWQPLGLEMHWLTGDEARSHEPLLAPDICAAIYAPQESQIRASLLTQAFARAAANQGAVLYSQQEVLSLQHDQTRVTGVSTASGTIISCKQLVIAVGAWAARCGDWLGIPLPIVPQRGQSLTLKQPSTPLRHIIFGEAVYLAPEEDGTIVVAATKEEVGFDKHVTAGGIGWLLTTAIRLVPSLERCSIERTWAGLRPKTPDNLPILGKASGWENVTVAVGHGSTGIMLSPITGKCIAELVMMGKEGEILRGFGVERFMDQKKES